MNNDSEGRWVNGSVGKIKDVYAGDTASDVVEVELSDASVVDV
ncbi:MAG TPA: hypothetical protein VFG01_05465 [Acidobacteriota bacterium]|nr:hypothetical protein [Acidobacteriota bacterium]